MLFKGRMLQYTKLTCHAEKWQMTEFEELRFSPDYVNRSKIWHAVLSSKAGKELQMWLMYLLYLPEVL